MAPSLESTDAKNKLEDLSGFKILPGQNPYEALIEACNNDPAEIQSLYSVHRVTRNAQQKEKFLSPDFKELIIDQYLLRLENPAIYPGFQDDRHCLVLWARPPNHVVELALRLQEMLKEASPSLWLMPPHRMHMTALEITHSRTPEEIAALVRTMRPKIPDLVNYTFSHRVRLVKPMLSYDLSALAVSFLPAAGEPAQSPPPVPFPGETEADGGTLDNQIDDKYTYHHLRRDIFDLVKTTGVGVVSRYVVPSAHITLARYLTEKDHATPETRQRWVEKIDEINTWLQKEVWDTDDGVFVGEWIVGQEKGLDARHGSLWYGAGTSRTIMLGEGF